MQPPQYKSFAFNFMIYTMNYIPLYELEKKIWKSYTILQQKMDNTEIISYTENKINKKKYWKVLLIKVHKLIKTLDMLILHTLAHQIITFHNVI